jgi:sugar phosphate isomerase/epimerase
MRKYNEEALPLLDELGVQNAEIFLTSFSEYEKPFVEFLATKIGKVKVNSVHALNTEFEPQLFSLNERVRTDAYAWVDKVLDAARILNAPYYTFHGTSRVKRSTHSGKNDNFPMMIEGFSRLVSHCQDKGVALCLENVEWSTYNRPGVFEILAKEIPALRGVLDIKQARISEYPYEQYLTEMGERLAHVHVSDVKENGKLCLPGKGAFDFDTLIKRLKDVGFDGAILIEAYQDDYERVEELKDSCDYLNELLYKNDCLR